MSFHEIRLPTRISYGAVGGPRFSTTIQLLNSGHEQRNINWSVARREYTVDISPSRANEWEALLSFFHARRGRAYGFRLKDFSDYKIRNEKIALADGVSSRFQVQKNYQDSDGFAPGFIRIINKIVPGSVTVFLDGVAQFGNWTINDNTGSVEFNSPPAEGTEVSVNCEFDVPVRFDTDLMEASIPGPDIHQWQSVKMIEIRQ
ncbi:DUF2460 domain-containing protein [Sneathiella aquimaris]|uniref:DUF2460 domain-containing protein n=1 Tax=Sneathiella aquimaris TaxID=2599305 RepID=UPI00146D1CB9|nr:DUF2460 domain-containing protein [Sneathiella aquimaris]